MPREFAAADSGLIQSPTLHLERRKGKASGSEGELSLSSHISDRISDQLWAPLIAIGDHA
jgi:hypothetical protein